MKNKESINLDELHKKNYGKNTMIKPIITRIFETKDRTGEFYHYTSSDGLKSILKNRSIYFTDCQFLNDTQERLSINKEVDKFWHYNREAYDKNFINILNGVYIEAYEDNGFFYSERYVDCGIKDEVSRYYVFSCSENNDCLNLWKYYSKNGTYEGYNIGLNEFALTDEWIDRDNNIAIICSRVIYEQEEKQEKIEEAVNGLYEAWCKYKISERFNIKIKNEFKAWLEVASLFFKDKHFKDECENRFVAITPKSNLSNLFNQGLYDFRLVNDVLTPFLNIPFYNWNYEECWAIDSITIGPTNNKQQKELGLKMYMEALDYTFPLCKVKHSNIPLRY